MPVNNQGGEDDCVRSGTDWIMAGSKTGLLAKCSMGRREKDWMKVKTELQ